MMKAITLFVQLIASNVPARRKANRIFKPNKPCKVRFIYIFIATWQNNVLNTVKR